MSNDYRFSGRVALVTGASSGIGAATAERLLREGAKVASLDLRAEAPEGVLALAADVRRSEEVDAAVAEIGQALGPIDVLVCSAGVPGVSLRTVDVPDEEWRNLHGKAIRAIRMFLASDLFEQIRATNPADWFPIEERAKFQLDGVDVWAAPDFARRRADGGAEIYDWKTGMASDANRLQLACYTLYMADVHGVDPARVGNHLVYLGEVHRLAVMTRERQLADVIEAYLVRHMDDVERESALAVLPIRPLVAVQAGTGLLAMAGA